MWATTVPLSNCWSPQSLTPGSLWNHEGIEANGQSPVRTASPYSTIVCAICGQCHVLHATVKLKAAREHKTVPLEREGVTFIWYNLYFSQQRSGGKN